MFACMLIISSVLMRFISAVEFCNWEIFQPRCSNNEIIVIEEAVFGRKTMGRCLTAEGISNKHFLDDPQFLGCHADVKGYLEQHCAGKKLCDVSVAKIEVETNCHKWLKFHLEIEYSCLSVVQESRHCAVNLAVGRQYISSKEFNNGGCGSKNQPWMIESTVGQQISIKMVYMVDSKNSKESKIRFMKANLGSEYFCPTLGEIVERQNKHGTMICLAEHNPQSAENEAFVTESNSIELSLHDNRNTSIGYVLAFEATGCSDLIPPADAWLKRTENEATIGCYSTRLRWQLKCVGQRWIGVIGNCSQGHQVNSHGDPVTVPVTSSQDQTVTVVAIAVAGFVVCFFIVCIGVVFLNRYYAVSKARMMKQKIGNQRAQATVYNEGPYSKYPQFPNDTWKSQNGNLINLKESTSEDPAQYFELDQTLVNKDLCLDKA